MPTTIDDIENALPWGLHDAYVEAVAIDWLARTMTITVRVMITASQDMDRRARLELGGFVYCVMQPPRIDPSQGYEPTPAAGLWIDSRAVTPDQRPATLPPTPEGCFVQELFVQSWNAFVYVCAREAALHWLENEAQPSRARTRALYPGDNVDV